MSRRQLFYLRVGLLVLGLMFILIGAAIPSGLSTVLVVVGLGILLGSFLMNLVIGIARVVDRQA